MLDVTDDEIKEFLKQWYCSRLNNKAEAKRMADDLVIAIHKKPLFLRLIHIPLSLCVIAVILCSEAQPSEERLMLHDKIAECLLYTQCHVNIILLVNELTFGKFI